MKMAHFFIDRPIFAWVIAIVVTLAGAWSVHELPIEQYPNVAPPSIQVSATYSGASAKTIQDSVVQVIEQQMTGLDHLMYMSSKSNSAGTAQIRLTFESGTDPDTAQVQVQDKLQAANARLPTSVQENGVTVSKSAPDQFLVLALVSEDGKMSSAEVGDYLYSQLEEPIERLNGIGTVQELGSQFAMRVWLDPGKLQKYALMPSDVSTAIAAQNDDIAAGELGGLPQVKGQEIDATITARSRLTTVQQFRDIVLKTATDGSQVLLSDVATVALGSEKYTTSASFDNKPASGLGLQLAPGANEVDAAKEVKAFLAERSATFPAGVKAEVAYETTPFVTISIEEVVKTLIEAIVLVVLIMYLFLQNLRATLIPTIAVPVVLMGTFGVLSAMGYTINTLTMFGLVLAIGLLVDDAIVVVENVERVMAEENLSPRDATRKSMSEISSALVGIAMVLSAVLLPMAFFGGSTGVIYRQFSVAVVSAMILSVLVALTLTPALCATLLKSTHAAKPGSFFGRFNRGFENNAARIERRVDGLRRHGRFVLVGYVAIIAVVVLLFMHLPTSFLPVEDQGVLMATVKLPPGATADRTAKAMQKVQNYFLKLPSVAAVFAVRGYATGANGQNVGMMYIRLKDWAERTNDKDTAEGIVRQGMIDLKSVRDAAAFVLQPPTVHGLGISSGFDMELVDQAGVGHDALVKARDQLIDLANQGGQVRQVRYNGLADTPQFTIDINDRKASAMGLSIGDINTTLADALGSDYVDDFIDRGRVKKVYVMAEDGYRMVPENIGAWYVRNSSGGMVPLSSFSSSHWTYGAPELDRYNGSSAFEIVGDPGPGVSSGDAMQTMSGLIAKLPRGVGLEWTGLSYQEELSGNQAPYLYAVSGLFVFLCLAALYESWSIPLAVMLVVPLGILGAALATWVRGLSADVYFQVGLLTTIGLSAKNAILIVEFAKMLEEQGEDTLKATLDALRLRIRPIVMTSLAFLLGVFPLVISTGAGAAARHSIGTGVFGGTLVGTTLALFFTPIFYLLVRRFSSKPKAETTPSLPVAGDHA